MYFYSTKKAKFLSNTPSYLINLAIFITFLVNVAMVISPNGIDYVLSDLMMLGRIFTYIVYISIFVPYYLIVAVAVVWVIKWSLSEKQSA